MDRPRTIATTDISDSFFRLYEGGMGMGDATLLVTQLNWGLGKGERDGAAKATTRASGDWDLMETGYERRRET